MSLCIHKTRIGQHHGRDEEGECQYCGSFMHVGDPAWEIMDGNQTIRFAYCSRTCCQRVMDDLVASGMFADMGGAR